MDRNGKKERTEDLNPRSDAIEEKVRRMMDLSVPDDPPVESKPTTSKKKSNDQETITIIPTAPELPDNPTEQSKEPKNDVVVKQITITDHNETPAEVAKQLDKAIAGLGPEVPATDVDATQIGSKDKETKQPTQIADQTDQSEEADPLDSEETDKAVDDIIASESDEILEIEDAVRDTDEPLQEIEKPQKTNHRSCRNLRTFKYHSSAGQ